MIRVLVLLTLFLAAPAAAQDVVAEDGYVAAAAPTARAHAAYVTLRNTGEIDRALVGAEAEGYAAVRLHRTVEEDGIARMEPVDSVVVPAGGRLAMEPGGLHIMLMGPKGSLEPGETVGLTLLFADKKPLPVEAEVREIPLR